MTHSATEYPVNIPHHWSIGIVVNYAGSERRGCEFKSNMCHNKNAIGEEGNGKPIHFQFIQFPIQKN